MRSNPLAPLARRRLTDFFEGAGQAGRQETVLALFRGRRLVIALLWALCQSVIGLFLLAGDSDQSTLNLAVGPLAISSILAGACLGVLWRDAMASRDLAGAGLEKAWRRARDRSVSRLAIFSLSLVVGGALALIWSKAAITGCVGCCH